MSVDLEGSGASKSEIDADREDGGVGYEEGLEGRIELALEKGMPFELPVLRDEPILNPIPLELIKTRENITYFDLESRPDQELVYLLSLTFIEGMGPATIRKLIAAFGNAKDVFHATMKELVAQSGIGQKLARSILSFQGFREAEREVDLCARRGIEVIGWHMPAYPARLREIFDSPPVIFVKGDLQALSKPTIAIVGTRRPSSYGLKMAKRYASFFAQCGFNVVSGLAYGIDAEVHKTVLECQGVTSAVLGHGLDRIYPNVHAGLAGRMMEKGSLVCEYIQGTTPEAMHFPARNRIISGLSIATIVIEAGESGGALITGRFAFEQNREVYAIPGDVERTTSEGCNKLIRDHIAKLCTAPEEVLEEILHLLPAEMGIDAANQEVGKVPQLEGNELAVWDWLGQGANGALPKGLGQEQVMAALLQLECKGLVCKSPGGGYRRR